MRSPVTCQTDSSGYQITEQRSAITELERSLWAGGLNLSRLAEYQAACRGLENLIAARGKDQRHRFIIVIPVADRPQQLRSCLDSLLELCRTFGYGGQANGSYRKVAVLIADDSKDPGSIAETREIAIQFTQLGLATEYFGLDQQLAVIETLSPAEQAELAGILGALRRDAFSHKGHAITRNIAYLKLAALPLPATDDRLLIYTVDSDQEFKVKVGAPDGDKEVCAINFLYHLDRIFDQTDAQVLTGKVVGDPPVSPSVMAGNFLEDVIGLLQQMAGVAPADSCQHHQDVARREGEASYHDMADLFGFRPASEAFRYRCPLTGAHSSGDCFDDFAARLNAFFYGEHPTRLSYYRHEEIDSTVQPARTVYAGNYVFRPAALEYFIPFAPLRLRMSGPTLGRLIKSEIGERFVSANLPMLHKRTVSGTGQSEFRPGVRAETAAIELCDEFERQFHGDVMLFSIERLTAMGYPGRPQSEEQMAATLAAVRAEMRVKYDAMRRDIVGKHRRLQSLLEDPEKWWNRSAGHEAAMRSFRFFADSIAHNFGEESPCHALLDSTANWKQWQARLLDAIRRYPRERRAWQAALQTRTPAQPDQADRRA